MPSSVLQIMQPNIQAAVKISYGNDVILYLTVDSQPPTATARLYEVYGCEATSDAVKSIFVKYILADLHRPCLYLLVLRI